MLDLPGLNPPVRWTDIIGPPPTATRTATAAAPTTIAAATRAVAITAMTMIETRAAADCGQTAATGTAMGARTSAIATVGVATVGQEEEGDVTSEPLDTEREGWTPLCAIGMRPSGAARDRSLTLMRTPTMGMT